MPPNLLHRLHDLRLRVAATRRRIFPGAPASNPFELYLIFLIILGGITILAGAVAPLSLTLLVDRGWQLLWGLELVAGGTMKLIGVTRNKSRLRIAGLRTLGWASLAYSVAILARLTPASPALLAYILGFAVACWAQARHVEAIARTLTSYQRRIGHDNSDDIS